MKTLKSITIFTILVLITLGTTLCFSKKSGKVNNGEAAPEINLPGPDGNNLKLSSLRGKYVLVDFWASWCVPCRKSHPYLVEMYKKYNAKQYKNATGFEVFSVSLDKEKQPWLDAIAADHLTWAYHVSDLKGWYSSAAEAYGVESIPTNFLLDTDGHIIAKGLHGADLDAELSKLK